ncbi:MAG: metalloregulator ArsR/SmtB family transcription factor [Ignavibacteria bacterium]|nr:metalloregulator ArsR/SmtB family transcription factor [Ignavibacteria bacterium]
MVRSKKHKFSKELIEISDFAKSISHPARLYIIKLLAERNECICGEIVKVTPLSQATVSQHLKELRKIGIIIGRIEGVKSCYCLDKKKLNYYTGKLIKYFKNK